jgi:hypothetical protein
MYHYHYPVFISAYIKDISVIAHIVHCIESFLYVAQITPVTDLSLIVPFQQRFFRFGFLAIKLTQFPFADYYHKPKINKNYQKR